VGLGGGILEANGRCSSGGCERSGTRGAVRRSTLLVNPMNASCIHVAWIHEDAPQSGAQAAEWHHHLHLDSSTGADQPVSWTEPGNSASRPRPQLREKRTGEEEAAAPATKRREDGPRNDTRRWTIDL
jgi:hypothetical protein